MIGPHRAAVVGAPLLACLVLLVGGCADDGNDHAADHADGSRSSADPADDPRRPTTVAGTIAGAAPTSSPSSPPVAPTGAVVPVIALDNSFRPAVVEIAVGDEVRWENRGLNEHNVLRVEGGGWGVEVEEFQPGDVYGHVFTEPGEYRYYCSIHGNTEVGMVGTVVVAA